MNERHFTVAGIVLTLLVAVALVWRAESLSPPKPPPFQTRLLGTWVITPAESGTPVRAEGAISLLDIADTGAAPIDGGGVLRVTVHATRGGRDVVDASRVVVADAVDPATYAGEGLVLRHAADDTLAVTFTPPGGAGGGRPWHGVGRRRP